MPNPPNAAPSGDRPGWREAGKIGPMDARFKVALLASAPRAVGQRRGTCRAEATSPASYDEPRAN